MGAAWQLPDPGQVAWRPRLVNILTLSLGWCLAVSALFINITTTSLTASRLVSVGVATYPLASFVICSAATCLPGALAMKRWGRRPVFLAAACLALVGAGLQLAALYRGSFGLLLVGAALQGPSFSQSNNYRFVAAEFAPPEFRPRAISLVVVGAVMAAAVGPEAARHLREALPQYNAGPYILLMGLYVAHIAVILMIDYSLLHQLEALEHGSGVTSTAHGSAEGAAGCTMPQSASGAAALEDNSLFRSDTAMVPAGGGAAYSKAEQLSSSDNSSSKKGDVAVIFEEQQQQQQQQQQLGVVAPLLSWRELLWNATFVVAALAAALSYAGMAALMSVTPVEMTSHGLSVDMSTWVVEAHIVAMFLPGLFMGDIMKLTGPSLLMVLGSLMLLGANGIFLVGYDGWVFFAGMVLIGLGWCAAYVAASLLVAGVYAREPRRRLVVQGTTDTCVTTLTGIGIGTASTLLKSVGWQQLLVGYLLVHGALLVMVGGYWAAGVMRSCRGRRLPASSQQHQQP